MVKCILRWSRWELFFVSACHLAAAISALPTDALLSLEIAIVIAVLLSYFVYLRAQLRTFIVRRQGIWQRAKPSLLLVSNPLA
jgi:hypothetical protein